MQLKIDRVAPLMTETPPTSFTALQKKIIEIKSMKEKILKFDMCYMTNDL